MKRTQKCGCKENTFFSNFKIFYKVLTGKIKVRLQNAII